MGNQFLVGMMLCMACRTQIETAYNDMCFNCYKKQKTLKVRVNGRVGHSVAG